MFLLIKFPFTSKNPTPFAWRGIPSGCQSLALPGESCDKKNGQKNGVGSTPLWEKENSNKQINIAIGFFNLFINIYLRIVTDYPPKLTNPHCDTKYVIIQFEILERRYEKRILILHGKYQGVIHPMKYHRCNLPNKNLCILLSNFCNVTRCRTWSISSITKGKQTFIFTFQQIDRCCSRFKKARRVAFHLLSIDSREGDDVIVMLLNIDMINSWHKGDYLPPTFYECHEIVWFYDYRYRIFQSGSARNVEFSRLQLWRSNR